jgi:hypothetical protein
MTFSDGVRRLTVDAVSFPNATDVPRAIKDRNSDRQGLAVPIPLPELENRSFAVHYVGHPSYIECDVVAGRIWVQVGLGRGKQTKYGASAGKRQIAAEFRADKQSYKLLKNPLPEIEGLAKRANAVAGNDGKR